MASSLHYSNGRLLLQNETDDAWYYVDVQIVDSEAHLRPGQVAIDIGDVDTFSAAAYLIGPDGNTYKFYLATVDGEVHAGVVESDPLPLTRLFVKGTNGLYYEISVEIIELQTYIKLTLLSAQPASSINSPWRPIVPVSATSEKTVYVLS